MKAFKFITVLFLILSLKLNGQNLVPNPSFENFVNCPTYDGQIGLATPWFNPTLNTPDYFNTCYTGSWNVPVGIPINYFGEQTARTGNAYAGFASYASGNVREYIEVKLINSLTAGNSYCITFFVSSADSCRLATSRVGAYFSTDSIYSNNGYVLNYVPQIEHFGEPITDAINWTKISGVFTAGGGEKFMTIGNFYNNANTDTITVGNYFLNAAYFYIDDISVYELPQDSATCFDGVGIDALQKENAIAVYPNPAANELIIKNPEQSSGFKIEKLDIYNIFGERVFSQLLSANSQLILNISELPSGVYFIKLTDMKTNSITKRFVKL